jgi:FkbM family methyltransferase
MNQKIKNSTKGILSAFDIGITRYAHLQSLEEYKKDINSILKIPAPKLQKLLASYPDAKSQLGQDLFVLLESNFKQNGFFVDFGATDGVSLSNSYLLEKEFGWNGILAEPAKCWHHELRENRTSNIDTSCVWRDSTSILAFREAGELSTMASYSSLDWHRSSRKDGISYMVNTISLLDLLEKYKAPEEIDYLSIDTEGSEYDILSCFDFRAYKIKIITCEHNFTPMRNKIYMLLTKNGYVRKYFGLSEFDDWYIKSKG